MRVIITKLAVDNAYHAPHSSGEFRVIGELPSPEALAVQQQSEFILVPWNQQREAVLRLLDQPVDTEQENRCKHNSFERVRIKAAGTAQSHEEVRCKECGKVFAVL